MLGTPDAPYDKNNGMQAIWNFRRNLTITGETYIERYASGGNTYYGIMNNFRDSTATFEKDVTVKLQHVLDQPEDAPIKYYDGYMIGVYGYQTSYEDQNSMLYKGDLNVEVIDSMGAQGIVVTHSNYSGTGSIPTITVLGDTNVVVKQAEKYNYGISTIDSVSNYTLRHPSDRDAGHFDFQGDLAITAEGGNNAIGMKLTDLAANKSTENRIINVGGTTTLNISGAAEVTDRGSSTFHDYVSNYGIYMLNIGAATFNDAEITTISKGYDSKGQGVQSFGVYAINSNASFAGPVSFNTVADEKSVEISALAEKGSNLTFANGLSSNGATALRADASDITAGASAGTEIKLSGKVEALNSSTITLNQKDGAMQLQGDVISDASEISIGAADSTGISQVTGQLKTANDGSIDGVFTGADSFYRNVNDIDTGHVNLSFSDSAQWQMTGSSEVSALTLDSSGALDMTYGNTGDKFGSFRTLTASSLSGEGGVINMNIDAGTNADNSDRVYVTGTHTGEHLISLNNVNSASLTDGANGTVLVSVGDEQGKFSALATEGKLYWNRYELGDKESATDGYNTDWYLKEIIQEETGGSDDKPTTSVEAGLSANALGYHTWRAEMDSLMQRMGDLRQEDEPDNGAWFRAKGGKINRDGAFGFENEYVMYQLGYDDVLKRTDKYTSYIGVAFSYTDGEGSYYRGDGENEGKEFGVYYTKMHKNGHYFDVAVKAGRWDNDFDVTDRSGNRISGDYDNNSFAFSAEYGRKIAMGAKGWYVEPQAQLSWGYFSGANYTMSNGVSVRQSGITSLLGRVGFNIGRDINKYSNIYLKANLYHEFCGDYSVSMNDGAGNSYQRSDVFDDTWFEYGIGAAFKWGEDARFYIDAERSAGSDYEKEWTLNAGLAWTF